MLLTILAAAALQAAPPAMPNVPVESTQRLYSKNDPDYASLKAFNDFIAGMLEAEPDARMLAAAADVKRIQESLPDIAHRKPFDATALSNAYRDLALARCRLDARRNEIVVERLAALPADQRALVIERIRYLAKPLIPVPPPPTKK